jgi:hypothetical protein
MNGLSFYEIVNNPALLQKMTCGQGEELTRTEQIAKLEQLKRRRKPRVNRVNPLDQL